MESVWSRWDKLKAIYCIGCCLRYFYKFTDFVGNGARVVFSYICGNQMYISHTWGSPFISCYMWNHHLCTLIFTSIQEWVMNFQHVLDFMAKVQVFLSTILNHKAKIPHLLPNLIFKIFEERVPKAFPRWRFNVSYHNKWRVARHGAGDNGPSSLCTQAWPFLLAWIQYTGRWCHEF